MLINVNVLTQTKTHELIDATVVPTKSDSDVMFCLQSITFLSSIDHLCINPIHRIGLIHKWFTD